YQSARQITGISRFKGRIGKSLTGTVSRNKVFKNGQSLFKRRENGILDNLVALLHGALLRLSHQSTHTAQLTNLLFRATCAGIGHHINRIKTISVLSQSIKQ